MAETLGSIAVEIGADTSPLYAGMDRAMRDAKTKGDKTGEAFGAGFASRVGGGALLAFSRVDDAIRGVQTTMRLVGDASGVGIAARYQSIQVGLTGVTGSAKDAKKTLDDLSDLGGHTAFNTAELVGFSQGLLGVGVTAQRIKGDMTALADAVATVNGGTEGLGRLADNMVQIKVSPHPEMQDVKQLMRMGLNLDTIVGSATGKQLTTGQGLKALQGMTGEKAYDTLITGFGKTYGGNAKKMADGTLEGVTQNVGEAFQTMMLPTGKMLIPMLTQVSIGARNGADALKGFNEATGGAAGFVGVVGVGTIALRLFGGTAVRTVGAVNTAATSITRLSVAIEKLAGASDIAATNTNKEAGKVRGMGGIGGIGGIGETAVTVGIPLGTGAIIGYFADKKEKGAAEGAAGDKDQIEAARLRGGQTGAEIGGTILGTVGAIAGSFVPGLGTIGGGAAGAAVGSLVGAAIVGNMAEADAKQSLDKDRTAERTMKAAEKTAAGIEKLSFSGFGGGDRLRGSLRSLEMEYAVARAMRTQIG